MRQKTYDSARHAKDSMSAADDEQGAGAGGATGAGRGQDDRRPIPTFAVRFESQDDFLVEYSDQLRHGFVRLPLPQPLDSGTPVRLRLTLPDGAALYVSGSIMGPAGPADPDMSRVKLHRLSTAQTQALERCVNGVVADASSSPDPHGVETDDDSTSPLSVLLVDDSVSHRIELGDALRTRGCRVRVAENGLLALASALKKAPDVILTDVEMPQMDGWGLLRAVRQRKRLLHVPVVFLTRLSDDLSRLKGYRMGADDFLPKTMAPDEVLARLHGVIARRRQLPAVTDAHGMRGDLEHVRLGSLLAFLESERRSGVLMVRNGSDHCTLYVRQGALARVESLGRAQHPHDRVFELLSWTFGQFEFRTDDETLPATHPDDDTPLSYLLMEHARRQDEAGAK